MEQDLNAERARLAEEVEVMSMSYIEKMQAQEKSMDLRLKQQQKSFLQAINSEI
ncbi:hypothetical protein MMC06_006881 [Schaereria dolodes]|nr:hypothetical protein [Schaereria dolodes]